MFHRHDLGVLNLTDVNKHEIIPKKGTSGQHGGETRNDTLKCMIPLTKRGDSQRQEFFSTFLSHKSSVEVGNSETIRAYLHGDGI